MRNAMGRVQFCPYKSAILNFNVASLLYLKIDRSALNILCFKFMQGDSECAHCVFE